MKRLIALILVVVLAPAAFTAGTAEQGSQGEVTLSPPGTFPLVDETVTYEVFTEIPSYIVDWSTNDFTLWYEEKTNVHLEWDMAPTQSLDERRSLVLASGDLPDFFMSSGMTREEEVTYGSQGAFIRLNELIEEHAPELQNVFGQRDYLRGALTTPNGDIYSLPDINECYHCWYSMRAWINHGWLDELGLDMPATTEEFFDAMVAMKTQDPNGNGRADEKPIMSSATGGWQHNVANFFINSFIYNHGDDRFFVDGGTVRVNYDTPEYRDALRYLNRLYENGLIAPESFTQDAAQFEQVGKNPEAEVIGVGVTALWWPAVGMDDVVNKDGSIRNRNYVALPPLEGPDGVRWSYYNPFSQVPAMQITSEAENPEILVRWADWMYSPEGTLYSNKGPNEGVDWRRGEPGEFGINGMPALWTLTDAGREKITSNLYNHMWPNHGPKFRSTNFRLGEVLPPDSPWHLEGRLYRESRDAYAPYAPHQEMVFPPVYVTAEEVGEIGRLKTTINDFVDESMVRFITGDLDIETDWDYYLDQLSALRLDRYLEIHQAAYDRQYR